MAVQRIIFLPILKKQHKQRKKDIYLFLLLFSSFSKRWNTQKMGLEVADV